MRQRKPTDPRGAHMRVYWEIVDSHAWKALNFSQQALYIACRRKLTSNNNGNLHFTVNCMKDAGFASPSTLANGLRALIATGFLAVTREGGNVRRGQTIPTLYRFTDEQCHEWKKLDVSMRGASNDWKRFGSKEDALQAIANADANAKAKYAERQAKRATTNETEKSSIQKPYCANTKSVHEPIRKPNTERVSDYENRIDRKEFDSLESQAA